MLQYNHWIPYLFPPFNCVLMRPGIPNSMVIDTRNYLLNELMMNGWADEQINDNELLFTVPALPYT